MNRYAIINTSNIVTNITVWDGETEWTPNNYQEFDENGCAVGDPTPQTAVLDTDPPTAQIDYIYNATDGTFLPVPAIIEKRRSFFARILAAFNLFN